MSANATFGRKVASDFSSSHWRKVVRQEDDFMYGLRHGYPYHGARRASAGMPQSLTIGLLRLAFLARPLLLRGSNTE